MTTLPNESLTFLLHQTDMSGRLVRLTDVAQDLATRQDFPPAVQGLIVEAAAVAAALRSLLKFQGKLIIQAKGKGPVSMLVAQAEADGGLRATATVNGERLAAYGSWPSFYALMGEGYVALTLDRGGDFERTQGIVALQKAGFAATLQHYFDQSDQVSLRLVSGARQAEQGWVAGALVLQRLPRIGGEGAADSTASGKAYGARAGEKLGQEEAAQLQWQAALALLETLTVGELCTPDLSSTALLYRLFHEQGVRAAEAEPLRRTCVCDRSRFLLALRSLPAEDLTDLFANGPARSTCAFCGTTFEARAEDL